ncbi:hypothetical protein I8752_30860 [Nostocaceae cyanobacterium CENA369]|uniref:Uncharacterized protein n=1 Tax=Dendronalium phyllosphericum CENA369 TaxID=1725256 RepID=A0A8J7I707_9NOST|nr:hypothetical protein [Dendronalium phyllosphericum]MBH8577290.1 hypothetical protein [Dendronalium phyllosphericum CENA369]
MKLKLITSVVTTSVVGTGLVLTALTQTSATKPAELTQQATQLRTQGPNGLDKFLSIHLKELTNASPQMHQALDALCQQKDCYASKLYWYTDLEQAKAAAKASNKPILSLRLLGRLDQDLSCANSRFFRVALYPNAEISKYLRQNYILHWESVRSAPKVTVDFGDGRKLERTITGNSIHYILDSSGRPVDAIPGLYGPQAFLRQLVDSERAIKEYSKRQGTARENFLRDYHRQRLAAIQKQWNADLTKLNIQNPPRLVEMPTSSNEPPSAPVAGTIAMTKMAVESPMLRNMSPATSNPVALREITDEATWQRIAQLYTNDAKLDKNSVALINAKRFQKGNVDLQRVVSNFETTMALDTARNEYMLHRQIHQWFIQGNGTSEVNSLNEKVYAELFLTPNSDPWLGLMSSESYSAIDNDGVGNSPVTSQK